jgi:hypothetical protein
MPTISCIAPRLVTGALWRRGSPRGREHAARGHPRLSQSRRRMMALGASVFSCLGNG